MRLGDDRESGNFERRYRPRQRRRLRLRRRRRQHARLPAADDRQPLRHRRRRRPGDRLFPAELARRARRPGRRRRRRARSSAGRLQRGKSTLDPQIKHFTLQVLGSTEDTWSQLFRPRGMRYTPTHAGRLFGIRPVGLRRRAVGDGAVLLPDRQAASISTPSFFNELSQRFQAPGDFARPMSSRTKSATTSRT